MNLLYRVEKFFENRVGPKGFISISIVGFLFALTAGLLALGPGVPFFNDGSKSKVVTSTTYKKIPDEEQFRTVVFKIEPRDGESSERCALLASKTEEHDLGLMHRDSLGRFDGMVFEFEKEIDSRFYMKNVRFPLSIAWFSGDGVYVSSTDMPLCTSDKCPVYGAKNLFKYALEVPAGQLESLGVREGSRLVLGEVGGC